MKLAGTADGPPFDRPGRGWYWKISGPANVLRSRSLGPADFELPDLGNRPAPPPPPRPPPGDDGPPKDRPVPADGVGPDGQMLHYRIATQTVAGVRVTIAASAPRDAVLGPLGEAMRTLAISLAVLGIALITAMLLQVRLGLRPVESLRRAIADVRAGVRERVPEEQPRELRPLADELNALLGENAANLDRARRHVSNLAHGLKTPLATMSVALRKEAPGADDVQSLVLLMDRRIRHHLGRARSAALGGPVRARTELAPRVADLVLVLTRVNAEKPIDVAQSIAPSLAVACEQQDVDEMLGNVLENAFAWCRAKVNVKAAVERRSVVLTIDDDGPGLSAEQMANAVQAGRRLDESAPGFGFGLSITRELAELYAGALTLSRSELGGLRAEIRLPAA
ncbi:ATP-binding protein [Rhodopseudomonas telluris]|uniref:histidine kinase n=1 Tax=Rhodopseudomonas telluris TaxID=644215 RepID=A0ABV6ENF4_9BRAD